MYPKVGETCKYVFEERFSSLDGIYTVVSIASLQEWMDLSVDINKELYERVGLEELDYEADLSILRNEDIYKLKHITSEVIVYIPMSFNYEIPNPHINAYQQIGLAVDLGIFSDPDKINWIIEEISQSLTAIVGVEKTPSLFEINKTWMTEEEYNDIETDRNAIISGTTNHYTEKQALINENTRLRTMIAQYENTLKLLNP
jgi:hypothetical protein